MEVVSKPEEKKHWINPKATPEGLWGGHGSVPKGMKEVSEREQQQYYEGLRTKKRRSEAGLSTGSYDYYGKEVTREEYYAMSEEQRRQVRERGHANIGEIKSKSDELAIKYAVKQLGKVTGKKRQHKWIVAIYEHGGQLVSGKTLLKHGTKGGLTKEQLKNIDPNETYIVQRPPTTKEMELLERAGEPLKKTLVKKEAPEETLKKIRGEKLYAYMEIPKDIKAKKDPIDWVTEAHKSGKEVKFTEDVTKIPKDSVIFRPDRFSIKKGQLYVHGLPVWLEGKVKEDVLLEHRKRRSVREEYRALPVWKKAIVAVRHGLTDIPATINLAWLKSTGQTEKYEKELTDVLVKQKGMELRKGKKADPRIMLETFTKGAGLIAVSRPIGMGIQTGLNAISNFSNVASKAIGAGVAGVGIGTTAGEIGLEIKKKEYGKALGKGVLVTGVVLGAIEGATRAKELGLGLKIKTVELRPKEVLMRGYRRTTGKTTKRLGRLDIRTQEGDVRGYLVSKTTKGGVKKYYIEVPKQKVGTIAIKKQIKLIQQKDFLKFQQVINDMRAGTTTKYTKTVRGEVSLELPKKQVELSLKNIDEVIKLETHKDVLAFKRMGQVKGLEAYVEKGWATPKTAGGKGILAKPDYHYKYFYIEQELPTKSIQPIIRGTIKSSTKGTTSSINTALKRMETLRQLQNSKIQASINKGNVGRILPSLLTPEKVELRKGEPIDLGQRMERIAGNAVEMVEQELTVRRKEKPRYIAPSLVDLSYLQQYLGRQGKVVRFPEIERIVDEVTTPIFKQPALQKPKQKQQQQVLLKPLINVPELPRIPLPEPIEIGRPTRIVPPFLPFYYASLRGGTKAIQTTLRTIRHKLMEIEKLI